MSRRGLSVWRRAFLLLSVMLFSSGCGLLRAPQQVVTRAITGKPSAMSPLDLQLQVQRFADGFASETSAAIDEYIRSVNTESARLDGLNWKLGTVSASLGIASGSNPNANLLDLVALTTLTRVVVEARMARTTNAHAFQPWLSSVRILETNVWKLAATVLDSEQVRELRAAILGWYGQRPEIHDSFFARPPEFAAMVKSSPEKAAEQSSVFNFLNLDPTAGLDPAVREVTLSRLFAERAMYTLQRLPFTVRLQTAYLVEQLTQQSGVQGFLTNAARISESTDRFSRSWETTSQVITGLPDRISREREAILGALDTQQGRLKELSANVGQTLAAGERMSTSLNTTLITFDALMKRFGVGEPPRKPRNTNAPPFNILDYAHTADQVSALAKELGGLLRDASGTVEAPALDKRMADLNAFAGRARADAQAVMNHAFLLAAGLIVLGFACALAYRRLVPRGTFAPAAQFPREQNPREKRDAVIHDET